MEKFNVKNGLSVGVDKLSIIDAVGSLSAASVTVNGQYTLPSLDGTSSQVIATDGSGNLSFISLSSGSGGADISGLSANWESTYTTVSTNSSSWGPQTLSFDESTANLTITNGNTVSLSALSSVNMGLFYNRWSFTGNGTLSSFSISGANASVSEAFTVTIDAVIQDPISYTVDAAADTITFSGVPELSSVIIIVEQYLSAVDGSSGGSGGGSDISSLSANWESTYTTVSTNSSSWGPQTLSYNESTANLTINNGNTVSLSALSASSTLPVVDTTAIVSDPASPTKRVRLDAGAVTAGQTRAIQARDGDSRIRDTLSFHIANSTSSLGLGTYWLGHTPANFKVEIVSAVVYDTTGNLSTPQLEFKRDGSTLASISIGTGMDSGTGAYGATAISEFTSAANVLTVEIIDTGAGSAGSAALGLFVYITGHWVLI